LPAIASIGAPANNRTALTTRLTLKGNDDVEGHGILPEAALDRPG